MSDGISDSSEDLKNDPPKSLLRAHSRFSALSLNMNDDSEDRTDSSENISDDSEDVTDSSEDMSEAAAPPTPLAWR